MIRLQPHGLPRLSRRSFLTVALASSGALAQAACGDRARETSAASPSANTPQSVGTEPIRQAADFALTMYQGEALVGGSSLRFHELLARGKPVVLNFWAGNCPPCRLEMPDFERAYQTMSDRALLIGIDVGPFVGLGSNEDGRRLVQELGITYPVGATSEAAVVPAYRVLGMPTTAFITPDGRIVRQWTGILDYDALLRLVDELVAASKP